MEDVSILKVLSQLENDLKEIKSAKDQVEAVIASDAAINESLSVYSKQIGDIVVHLDGLKDAVKAELLNVVGGVGTDIADECEKMSKTIYAIQNFASDVDERLEGATKKILDDFKLSSTKTSDDFLLKANEATSEFSKKSASICSNFINSTNKNIEDLKAKAKDIRESSADIIQIKVDLLNKLKSIQTDVDIIKKVANDIESGVKAIDEDLTVVYDTVKDLVKEQTEIKGKVNSVESSVKQLDQKYDQIFVQNKEQIRQTTKNKQLFVVAIILMIINIVLHFV